MKNTAPDKENSAVVENGHFNCALATQPKGGQSLTFVEGPYSHSPSKCNILNQLDNSDVQEMGHKSRFYCRVLSKKVNAKQESRSQSLPTSLAAKNKINNANVSESCDTKLKLLPPENEAPPQSPQQEPQELWFNTWPERASDKKSVDVVDCSNTQQQCDTRSDKCENTSKSVNNILTLNEALQSISLAYSPVTKQLHLIQNKTSPKPCEESAEPSNETEAKQQKLGHRRTEAGSFSSTVSSLSDPSPSGSLLDAEERTPSPSDAENGTKSKRKGLTGFFSRNVFSWRSAPSPAVSNWSLFSTIEAECPTGSPKHEDIVASSSALIQHLRPSHLPAKDLEEEQRHRDEYKAMLAAAKRREVKHSAAKHKQQKIQLQVEDQLASATKFWNNQVLPKWDSMQKTKKTRDIWWQGIPSSVRGKVWRLAIGNDLNVTQQLYEICLSRAQNRLNNTSETSSLTECGQGKDTVDQESSLDVIRLDIARTFPHLCIFQEGGPYSEILHSLLAAYVCYRPDVGYVQGMSFIAAVLILNMELFDAFICFANLLNRPLHLAAYTLNQAQMQAYYAAYNQVFSYNLPRLYTHFETSGLTPDLYLLDWVYTVFAKAMPLDVACRVWDVFLRDGDEFIFRTALGVLHLHQDLLLQMDFLHGSQYLTRLPDDLSADNLFKSIQSVTVCIGKQTFGQIADKCKESL